MLDIGTARARWAATRAAMAEAGLDLLVVAGRGLIAQHGGLMFLAGYSPVIRHAFVVVPQAGDPILLVTTPSDIWLARQRSPVADIRLMQPVPGDPSGGGAALREIVRNLDLEAPRIGVTGMEDALAAADYLAWCASLPAATFRPAGDVLAGVKLLKSAADVAALEKAAVIVDDAFGVLVDSLRTGASLRHATGAAEGMLRGEGAVEILVYLSENPHFLHRPSAALPQPGMLLTCFVEASFDDGHWVELARLIGVGELGARQLRIATLGAQAMRCAEDALRPGLTAGAAYDRIQAEITRGGLGSGLWYGHGVGIDHDAPVIGQGVATVLQPGMVIALHPHLVDAEADLGSSFCDTFVIGPGGGRPLSRLSRDLVTI